MQLIDFFISNHFAVYTIFFELKNFCAERNTIINIPKTNNVCAYFVMYLYVITITGVFSNLASKLALKSRL
jgi:hypothetical protein